MCISPTQNHSNTFHKLDNCNNDTNTMLSNRQPYSLLLALITLISTAFAHSSHHDSPPVKVDPTRRDELEQKWDFEVL